MLFLLARSPGLLSLLSCRLQDHLPRGGTTHSGLGSPQSAVKTMPHRLACRPICWRHFLREIAFPDDSSLCQVGRKLSSMLLIDPACTHRSPCSHLHWSLFVSPSVSVCLSLSLSPTHRASARVLPLHSFSSPLSVWSVLMCETSYLWKPTRV